MNARTAVSRLLPVSCLLLLGFLAIGAKPVLRPPVDPHLYSDLKWRNIGPFRAGRTSAVSGAIGDAGVFYMGAQIGGVWKTTSAGMTWFPVFDSIKEVSSIGAVEVAPSAPNTVYVGTGDALEGNGVYKSTDAGATWRHIGLEKSAQIPSILVDPKNPDLVVLAALGTNRVADANRGVYRSTDGGRNWTKTLYVDSTTGIQNLVWAFDNPSVIMATTVRRGAGGRGAGGAAPVPGAPPAAGRGGGRGGRGGGRGAAAPAAGAPAPGGFQGAAGTSGLYKSTDEGVTWKEITGGGLPALTGRMLVAVAMHSNSQRMYLIGGFGLYRSDNGGTSWRQVAADDQRIRGGEVYVSSQNPDYVITLQTCSYLSKDGGVHFEAWRCSPGGDDPRDMWIDPIDPRRMLIGFDQGATLTIDWGATWSSWYNQPTSQVYHITVDNSSPYWVYASQQDACLVQVRSRGILGAVTLLDWFPTPGYEWGGIAVDPLDPKKVYSVGSTEDITRITWPSGQWMNVAPNVDSSLGLVVARDQMFEFNKSNPHELLVGYNKLVSTLDGGVHWKAISPDLGYAKGVAPVGRGGPTNGGGTITTIGSSSVSASVIWVGTSNGLVKVTKDHGVTWEDASIPENLGLVSNVDASHQDAATAYVAARINGDQGPGYWRTHDYGKTWTKIINGLRTDQPSGNFSRVIRTDTKKAGLLFAGTESAVYVSFDDGDNWQSLMLNLPTTSMRDLAIKDNDLIVGTYGRSIWILDDYSPLRQITPAMASEPAHLFKPGDATRIRQNINAGTPLQIEIPHGENPPLGAVIYYQLNSRPTGDITLEISDAGGRVVRHMSSAPIAPFDDPPPPVPDIWLYHPQSMSTGVGNHRINWDLRYDRPSAFNHFVAHVTAANPGQTIFSPIGPLVLPGVYTLKLTVNGKSYTQTVTVKNDPNSPVTAADLAAQHALQMKLYDANQVAWDAWHQVTAMRDAVARVQAGNASAAVKAAAQAFDAKLVALAGTPIRGGRGGRASGPPTLASSAGYEAEEGQVFLSFHGQLKTLEPGDMAPTPAKVTAWTNACKDLGSLLAAWRTVNAKDLVAFNGVLTSNNQSAIAAEPALTAPSCGVVAAAAAPAAGRGRGGK